MKYLLDTHVWIWLLDNPAKLSKAAAQAINRKNAGACGVSDISSWEVARKESLGKLSLALSSRVWLRKACAAPGIEMIRVDPEMGAGQISGRRIPVNSPLNGELLCHNVAIAL